MKPPVARALKQTSAFASPEQHVVLGLRVLTARLLEPWEKFLKTTAGLTSSQYNVLRILRGSHPTRLPCSEISERMIARDPDVTRLVDRLGASGLVERVRAEHDRRVVEVGITPKGIALDAASNLYIADTFMHRVRRVDAVTRGLIQCGTTSWSRGPNPLGAIKTRRLRPCAGRPRKNSSNERPQAKGTSETMWSNKLHGSDAGEFA